MEETKICTKCGQELPISDFYWRDKKAGKRRSEYKYCHNGYVKQKYKERHEEISKIKSGLKCAKCGDSRFYVLDFHHIDPAEKDNGIAEMLRNNTSWDKIQEEIAKCIPLCANCHREFHYLEKEEDITLNKFLASK